MEKGFQRKADLLTKLLTLYKIMQVWQKVKNSIIATLCHCTNFQYKESCHLVRREKIADASGSQMWQQENKHTIKN